MEGNFALFLKAVVAMMLATGAIWVGFYVYFNRKKK